MFNSTSDFRATTMVTWCLFLQALVSPGEDRENRTLGDSIHCLAHARCFSAMTALMELAA